MRAPFPIYDLRFTIHGVRFLRRGNRRRGMAERDTSDRDWPEELNPEEPEQRIRVRDRRRINLDGDAAAEGGGTKEARLDGLRGTISGFEGAVAQAGAEPIEAVGQQFDPEIHEAVDTIEVEPEREGTVTAQYSRGYRMGGQLLRPARVQVGRARGAAHGAGE